MRRPFLALLLLAALLPPWPADARTVVKLGTLAPKNSPWYNSLKRMGDDWERITAGEVTLQIYPGGVLGNETDMVRKLQQGRLQAATLTIIGIRGIDPGMTALQVPLLVDTFEGLDAAGAALRPKVERRLADAGYVLLQMGDTGWVHLFTRDRVATFEGLKRQKLFVADADPASREAWRRAGFSTVDISSADILPGLQTGLIDGFLTTPLAALVMQWFSLGRHMLSFRLSPLVGGTIVSAGTWKQIPERFHAELLASARRHGDDELRRIRELGASSIDEMKKHGLQVVDLPPAELAKLVAAVEAQWPFIRGNVVPADLFDLVRQTARTAAPAATPAR